MPRAERNPVQERFNAAVNKASKDLSDTVLSALAEHPDALRAALAVAGDALSARPDEVEVLRGTKSARVSRKVAERRIAARTRPDTETKVLTADEVARRIGLKTRQSVHDWLKKKKILGWQGAKRGYVFPAAQFDERGRPPEGLAKVMAITGDAFATWHWLICETPALDGATPLQCLRVGELERVLMAAEGAAQGDFM